jgi:hypothetical protein
MKHTLKSLLITTVLTLPSVLGAAEFTNLEAGVPPATGVGVNAQEMRAIPTQAVNVGPSSTSNLEAGVSPAAGLGVNAQEMHTTSSESRASRNAEVEETLEVARVTQIDVATELRDVFRELDLGPNISDPTILDAIIN